ncbi:MAG: ROK family transcriptional regulator, partial [Alistipes sp.]|nr:ROK family transcriptional regulator [Alistipes sp.]
MSSSLFRQADERNRAALIKQQIINQYIVGGDSSITELSKALMLSVPTVTKFLGELIEEGFVYDYGKQGNVGGRQPNIYGLNPDAGYFIGVELRKDTVQLAVTNFKAQVVANREERYVMAGDPLEAADQLCAVIRSFIVRQNLPHEKIRAVGVSISGRVNPATGYSY